jgi:phenylalanyl-tRNA synthetase beta chain
MPTIDISKRDLERLSGRKFTLHGVEDWLLIAKAELEAVDGDVLKVDVKDTNRPDLWSVEGIARELRGFVKERGVPKYSVKRSGIVASVDPRLRGIRQYAAYAVVEGVKVTEDLIKQMVQLQEKVCQTFGRKRDEVAIGIFDFDKVHGNVKYIASPWKREFVPLGYKVSMRLDEILVEHPKGIEYGKLIKGKKFAPLLVDENDDVLSMPPVINSAGSGKITPQTRNLFIDVTGHEQETINIALRIVCAALADRGGKVESVDIKYGNRKITTPDIGSSKITFDFALVEEYSGLGLSGRAVLDLLRRRRMEGKLKGKKLVVDYPNYRPDVLHAVDIIEDIIIGYGYNRIAPQPVVVGTVGKELEIESFESALRELCVGLGLQEVLTYTLTSRTTQERKIASEFPLVEIANPVSSNYTVFRKHIFPELLELFARNKHNAYPQRVFEIGRCVVMDKGSSTGVSEPLHLCVAVTGDTNFTQIKSVLDAITLNMGIEYRMKKTKLPFLNAGRCAEIEVNGKKGFVGEVSNSARKEFDLPKTTTVLEIEF